MDTSIYMWTLKGTRHLLVLAALLSPITAVAALATNDIAGTARTGPTTIGAMESIGAVGTAALPAPTGLAVQRI